MWWKWIFYTYTILGLIRSSRPKQTLMNPRYSNPWFSETQLASNVQIHLPAIADIWYVSQTYAFKLRSTNQTHEYSNPWESTLVKLQIVSATSQPLMTRTFWFFTQRLPHQRQSWCNCSRFPRRRNCSRIETYRLSFNISYLRFDEEAVDKKKSKRHFKPIS